MKKLFYLVACLCVSASIMADEQHKNFIDQTMDLELRMVWIDGGEFMMGCTSEQSDCSDDEMNVRKVKVSGFYIGMLEITQWQWKCIMGTTLEQQRDKLGKNKPLVGKGDDYPMYYVSWNEATEFCRILSEKTGKKYMLPTEAQWEYAARGGKYGNKAKSMFSAQGHVDDYAWYKNNSGNVAHPCGIKKANILGLYDMTGNVWEWCSDFYSEAYRMSDTVDPKGPGADEENRHVNRGGSWDDNERYSRVSMRYGSKPTFRENWLGFRVVMIP